MDECETRTQGASIAALWARLRTQDRAAQRGRVARASFRKELIARRDDMNRAVIGRWERVLVLAPHTDDGEFGCGGTMARLADDGADVRYVAFSIATRSLPEGFPPDTLGQEVRDATAELGIPESSLTVHDFDVRT